MTLSHMAVIKVIAPDVHLVHVFISQNPIAHRAATIVTKVRMRVVSAPRDLAQVCRVALLSQENMVSSAAAIVPATIIIMREVIVPVSSMVRAVTVSHVRAVMVSLVRAVTVSLVRAVTVSLVRAVMVSSLVRVDMASLVRAVTVSSLARAVTVSSLARAVMDSLVRAVTAISRVAISSVRVALSPSVATTIPMQSIA